MRELKIGNKEIRVRATPLALLFYKQAFKSDLIGDMIGLFKGIGFERISNLDTEDTEAVLEIATGLDVITLLQITWAMAKADALGKQFPSFEKWLTELEQADFFDPDFLLGVLGEAVEGFFRRGGKPGPKKSKKQ